MDPRVLTDHGASPTTLRAARLRDWSIGFTPFATIVPRKGSAVWGVVGLATPGELESVYGQPLFPERGSGHRYYPEAVVVSTRDRKHLPALVYVSYKPGTKRPESGYLEILLRVARKRRFPRTYLRQLETYR